MAFIRTLGLLALLALVVVGFASTAAAADSPQAVCEPGCLEECRAEYGECRQDVREHFKETYNQCLDLNCRTVIAQARRICAAHPDSDDCKNARAHAETCIQRCKAVAQHEADEEIAKCRRALNACVEECKRTLSTQ